MKRLENPDEGAGELPIALIDAVRTFCSVGGQRPESPLLGSGSGYYPLTRTGLSFLSSVAFVVTPTPALVLDSREDPIFESQLQCSILPTR